MPWVSPHGNELAAGIKGPGLQKGFKVHQRTITGWLYGAIYWSTSFKLLLHAMDSNLVI